MAVRQIRHLQEVPSDFFRLPMFIIVSTFFLMPIRLLGFLRMAHASGWGTRAGAYAGGDQTQAPADDGGVDAGTVPGAAAVLPTPRPGTIGIGGVPVPAGVAATAVPDGVEGAGAEGTGTVSRRRTDDLMAELESLHGEAPADVVDLVGGLSGTAANAAPATVAVRERRAMHAAAPAPAPRRRHFNPLAGIPYLIAVLLFGLEALLYV
ncbi:hypothetical protein AGMMS50218_17920 [Actinomycetota bacterium]|nr:hypothetical protein AGMMS50218_17920 [Actinomycetota bacterium]